MMAVSYQFKITQVSAWLAEAPETGALVQLCFEVTGTEEFEGKQLKGVVSHDLTASLPQASSLAQVRTALQGFTRSDIIDWVYNRLTSKKLRKHANALEKLKHEIQQQIDIQKAASNRPTIISELAWVEPSE